MCVFVYIGVSLKNPMKYISFSFYAYFIYISLFMKCTYIVNDYIKSCDNVYLFIYYITFDGCFYFNLR